jgi:hypothetical protein
VARRWLDRASRPATRKPDRSSPARTCLAELVGARGVTAALSIPRTIVPQRSPWR